MYQKIKDDRKVLLIDMDNTLNKFWVGFERTYNLLFNKNISINRKDLKTYNILANFLPDVNDDVISDMRQKIFEREGFWVNQPAYEDSAEILEKLNEKYNVYIVTSPWTTAMNCYTEKIEWMKKYFPFIPLEKVVFTRDKWIIKCDYVIDDAPFYLDRNDCKTIAMDYAYNKKSKTDFRADNWKDIGNYLGVI